MPNQKIDLLKNEQLDRSIGASFIRSTANDDERTVEIAFSSEAEVPRGWFIEVLDHGAESVRLERINNAGAFLVNHNTDDQVGVVESARIDSDGIGRAVIRFSQSARGQEIYDDVKNGIRQLISVRYLIHKYEVTESDGEPDMVRVMDWEPIEISIVSIPADPSVGVGRSLPKPETEKRNKVDEMPKPNENAPAPELDVAAERAKARKEEMKRINLIRSVAETHELEELGRQAIEEDWTAERFNTEVLSKVGERNNKARAESEHDGEVDLTPKERKAFSLIRLMEAVANPSDRSAQQRAAFELEVGDAAIKDFGADFKARGVYIPESVLARHMGEGQRAQNVTTPAAGGNLVATNLLSAAFIDVLRNTSSVMRLGATMLSGLVGNVDIPKQLTGTTMGWLAAEDDDAPNSEATFGQISLTPKDAAVYTELTRRSLQQTTPAIDGLIRRDLAMAIALGIDKAALYGTGATGQPLGIANQTNIFKKTFAAANPTYAELVSMITEVMKDNALTGVPAWLFDATGWGALSTTPKQASGVEGNFILGDNDRVKGYNYLMSNQVTAEDYFFGDFSQLLIGEWGGMELNVDPYTHSLKGRVRFVAFKTIDTAVRHAESFAHGNDTI